MSPLEIRQATADDVEQLVARWTEPHEQLAERERFAAQERGESLLLIAWDDGAIVGRLGRLYFASKYDEVRLALGEFPEINALDAWPQGRGVGTQLIRAAEAIALGRGCRQIGIAVLTDNLDARRLYERLGYEPWGEVVDVTEYRNEAGELVDVQRDRAVYLVKDLAGSP